jgi:two-component system, cell cycle sensor histidine kinase PleC
MHTKQTRSSYVTFIVLTLGVLFVLTCINSAVSFIMTRTIQINSKKEMLSSGISMTWLSYYSVIVFCAVFFLAISILVLIKRLLDKERDEGRYFDETVNLQGEVEKQDKEIMKLTNLYHTALENNKAKTEFFSNISHEFKTPISVILGSIQLLEQKLPEASPERLKFGKSIEIMRHNCYRLLRLINNILDMTRMDSGYIKINKINCNIVYLVEEITQSVAPFAEQKKLTLLFDTEVEEIMTAVDVDKIERVLLNLLSNAIKYTDADGKIWVTIFNKDNRIFISVKDTGYGIPQQMQALIFERFKQVSSQLTKDFEGSGIGLSIVKSFVDLHGGSIQVISEENKGSEFIVELPVLLCDESGKSAASPSGVQSRIVEAINIEFSDIYSHAS